MNIELTEKLVSKYPSIFAQYGGDPKDTSMAYGIECGNGWFDIIDTLCHTIQSEVDHINFNYEVSCVVKPYRLRRSMEVFASTFIFSSMRILTN